MAVLVGIDEAGFGPILGPLVVSSSTFSVPDNLLKANLWEQLRKSVSAQRKHLAGRLLIADSKKAYSKTIGIKHLERTVLASLKCLGYEPAALPELMTALCPQNCGHLSEYPWYQNVANHYLAANKADIEIAASAFKNDLTENNIKLLNLASFSLDVAQYNNMVSNVKNKANVLFSVVSTLIKRAYDKFAGETLQIIIDRQGGREHYRSNLQRMFPDMELKILLETPGTSSYELTAGGKTMRLHFTVAADDRFLPVSLASMVSKYLRELMVENINRYFTAFHAELKPTAGYWQDGLRFINDIKTFIPHVTFDNNLLIRCR